MVQAKFIVCGAITTILVVLLGLYAYVRPHFDTFDTPRVLISKFVDAEVCCCCCCCYVSIDDQSGLLLLILHVDVVGADVLSLHSDEVGETDGKQENEELLSKLKELEEKAAKQDEQLREKGAEVQELERDRQRLEKQLLTGVEERETLQREFDKRKESMDALEKRLTQVQERAKKVSKSAKTAVDKEEKECAHAKQVRRVHLFFSSLLVH